MTDAALDRLLTRLESRGLHRGVGALRASTRLQGMVRTGHLGLDEALGTGGWPRGGLSFLDTPLGGGATTLALASLAAAQSDGGLAAWLDLDGTFDPAVAARLDVSLEWLLVARPRSVDESIDLAAWLCRSGHIDALVLDLGERGVAARRSLDRLGALLKRGNRTSALALAPSARAVVGSVADVRVALHRSAWLAVGRDLVGQRVRAVVERNRWALAGRSVELDLWFGEGRRIDPLLAALAEPQPLEPERPALRVVSA